MSSCVLSYQTALTAKASRSAANGPRLDRSCKPFMPRLGRSAAGRCFQRDRHFSVKAIAAPELGSLEEVASSVLTSPRYQNSDWAAAFTSQFEEYEYYISEIEGEIPATLRGTLFRNGPGRFERGKQKYEHMLDGDGYVQSFSFNDNGSVYFRSKFVRTSEWQKEHEADAVLYRNTFGTQPKKPLGPLQNAFDLYLKNPANTNVVLWGNRLLALWEAGCPFELDPWTLDTYPGPETLGGFLTSGIAPSTTGAAALDRAIGLGKACTAHPHVVPGGDSPDRLAIFSWQSHMKPFSGSEMVIDIHEFDENWQKVSGQTFAMQKSFFNPHDFAITDNYYVFFQNDMSFQMGQYLLGLKGPAQCVNFDDGPMKIHLVPRKGGKPIVIDGVEPSFLIHHANAFEEGDEVVVWSSGWSPESVRQLAKSSGSGMLGSWKVVLQGDFSDIPVTSLWSHRINTHTGKVTRQCLFAQSNDHPRVNPCYYSQPTRFVYINMCMTDDADASNPPQVGPRVSALPPVEAKVKPAPAKSNIVPAPKFLGRTKKALPAKALPKATEATASGLAGVSWTTKNAGRAVSITATPDDISNSPYLHAYGPRDVTPYTPIALPIGGVPAVQHTTFQLSLLTAKDRLRALGKISWSDVLLSTEKARKSQSGSSAALSSVDEETLLEEAPFPASASLLGKQLGSTRAMGSLEWLNMSSGPPKAFTRVDTHTGEAQTWFPGRRCFCEELIFVNSPGATGASREDEGYLLGLVYDASRHRSFLAVLDAADFSKGPVARLWLKHHVPHGLHGFWSPQSFGPRPALA